MQSEKCKMQNGERLRASAPSASAHKRRRPAVHFALCTLHFAFCTAVCIALAQSPSPTALQLYEKKIRPLFAQQCYPCHGPKQQQSGLRLDRAADLRKGGNRGPAIAADPEKS